jgi:type IV pilus assembly protein PilY1
LGEVNQNGTKYHVVYIGTGRYLGGADFGSTDLQSIYAIKDDWTATAGLGDARASGKLVTQTLSAGADSSTRTASNNAVDWVSKSGWMVDLTLSSGERVNVNMSLSFNILTVASNVPRQVPVMRAGSHGSIDSTSPRAEQSDRQRSRGYVHGPGAHRRHDGGAAHFGSDGDNHIAQ